MNQQDFTAFGLSKTITDALAQLGYKGATAVQEAVIPVALAGDDVIVKSRTGSGKTAAFGIPLCEMLEWEENKPQALILTPTRELALQVKEDVMNIGRYKRIKATAVFGKQPFRGQVAELKQKSHVVVGTPGRVLDHIARGTLTLDRVRHVVLDEADEMLSMGFLDQVKDILDQLPPSQTMLFSATMPDDIERLSQKYLSRPERIEIESPAKADIEHAYIEVSEKTKFAVLKDVTVAENPDRCIVFCRTKENVDFVAQGLAALDYPVEKIHGGMEQDERFAVMKAFRAGKFRYLVATDVAARGIDVDGITHVVQYDLPVEKESYVHRSGRTGRAGEKGLAISLVEPRDARRLKEIEDYLGRKIEKRPRPTEQDLMRTADAFEDKLATDVDAREKTATLNAGIMKLFFNGGKKKKLRAVDFVGTIAKIDGVSASDIGIITIEDMLTYVEILNGKGKDVLRAMKTTKVKGKQLKVYEAHKK
ncbi:DEAD/DEAH box helicase [Exiguobacterium flavidum]|uniref:DEAD/DEAH box helicase n=1 Tax=Exiguobacterium flavidum TaxID=2184695 RepID=UPI000DF7941E|nr:DEAD/DEAH box helicase [Exiguobacterium flavidum]